ncbi:hypothetical protein [Streptomyces sp. NPDC087856]|uniref:hypothetical protein n=1 Tax=Streptomyces sp. NPDC087856 TaxID=3365811 RepID=UPI0038188102
MTKHHVEISVDGTQGQVLIDGHDIARGVTGLVFRAGIDGAPTLTLDLQLVDVTPLSSPDTEVLLGSGVAEALKVLGWTPPEDNEG